MGGSVGHLRGGIIGLHRLITEHGEAIQYDLLIAGYRLEWLGTRRLSWWDLLVFVKRAPRGSALARSVHGEKASWGTQEYLLALLVDVLQHANWQRANAGNKNPPPSPRPIRRPGTSERIGGTKPLALDELDKRLGYSPRA